MSNRGVSRSETETPELAEVGPGFWWFLLLVLGLVLSLVLYRVYFGSSSYAKIEALEQQLAEQQAYNEAIAEMNRRLAIEIEALKNGDLEIETRAREDLGLVKPGETFYLVTE